MPCVCAIPAHIFTGAVVHGLMLEVHPLIAARLVRKYLRSRRGVLADKALQGSAVRVLDRPRRDPVGLTILRSYDDGLAHRFPGPSAPPASPWACSYAFRRYTSHQPLQDR